jgi:hypothetical protein
MNFETRGESVISCSALPRLAACPGSWQLSKGCPDTETEDGKAGDIVHWLVSFFAVGGDRSVADKYQTTHPALWDQARAMWGHAKRSAEEHFCGRTPNWKSEEREWLLDSNLNPILSGQPDLIAYEDDPADILLYDLKSGFMAGDVPSGTKNWQLRGLAKIIGTTRKLMVFGSVVREWAADELEYIETDEVDELLDKVYAATDAGDAGLKTGAHCRWCPANLNGKCPIKRDQLAMVLNADKAVENFTLSLQEMPDEGLVRILKAKKPAVAVLDAAETEVRRRRAAGVNVTGVVFEPGDIKRTIKDLDGLLKHATMNSLAVPTKLNANLSDIEGVWMKANGLKGKEGKDAFSRTFKDFLEFKSNKESIVV